MDELFNLWFTWHHCNLDQIKHSIGKLRYGNSTSSCSVTCPLIFFDISITTIGEHMDK